MAEPTNSPAIPDGSRHPDDVAEVEELRERLASAADVINRCRLWGLSAKSRGIPSFVFLCEAWLHNADAAVRPKGGGRG